MRTHRTRAVVLCLALCTLAGWFSGLAADNTAGAGQNLDGIAARLSRPGTTLEDARSLLGEPETYFWGRQTFSKEKLPKTFILHYTNGVDLVVHDGLVEELRCEGPPGFSWEGKLRLGSKVEDVLLICGPPSRIVTGQPLNYGEGVLYQDIDGKRGVCYYAPEGHPARFFFKNYEVSAVYVSVPGVGEETQKDSPKLPDDYRTLLSPTGRLEIVRRPPAANFHRKKLRSLPAYDTERAGSPFMVDLRSYDLTALDVSNRLEDLLHANFDSKTRWPAELPAGFQPAEIMRLGSDPGLGVRELHARGITGKGVGVGIIDQALLVGHVEYRDRLRLYEEIHWPESTAQMHGPAVASIAVGKTVGVAPGADLYYIAETHGVFRGEDRFDWDFTYVAKSIDRLLTINETLPKAGKIRVISISVGWSPGQKGFAEVTAAVGRATGAGVLVLHTALERLSPFAFNGLGRDPMADPNAAASYGPGTFWSGAFWSGEPRFTSAERLMVPMDSRCLASPTGDEEYVFYSEGGWSWAVPWIAGLYALACQVEPNITPQEFWSQALATGDTITLSREDKEVQFGPIANPGRLIKALEEKRAKP